MTSSVGAVGVEPASDHLRLTVTAILLFLCISTSGQVHTCVGRGGHPMPVLSSESRRSMEQALSIAQADARANPQDAERLLWLGRRLGYLGRYHDAIEVFTIGAQLHPSDPRFLRHRGHRWITLRCLDSAVSDLRRAAALVKGKPDETEPDGMPNQRNIPTSTLQSNIWYHLGLALYLQRDYRAASSAWRQCLKVSDNNDMFVAAANWHHLTLIRMGRQGVARRFLRKVDPNLELIENADYLSILRLYQSSPGTAEAAKTYEQRQGLSSASYGYGLGCYLLMKGDKVGAREVFNGILAGGQWGSFGFIAAESEGLQ